MSERTESTETVETVEIVVSARRLKANRQRQARTPADAHQQSAKQSASSHNYYNNP